MTLRVWAPAARSLVCRSGGADTALDGPDAAGWWSGPHLPPGADYGLLVDSAGPFPDPRSAWQPAGVHGASRVFDVGAFEWSDAGWAGRDARGAVTYELHVGTFTPGGTLDTAVTRLPELAAAGIEMVSLMPLAPMPGERGWGYDGVSLYAVHEPYGGPAALQRFVDAAHAAGVGVTLDVVYNHLGPDGNYLAQFGPYFTDAHHTPWGWAVNLDQPGSDEVRRYLIDNALRWFRDFHLDALRLDAVHELHDDSPRHFLAELADAVAGVSRELGRPLSLVAESDRNDPATVTPASGGGLGMTAQWADDVHHALHTYLTGERHGYYVDFGSVEVLDHAYRRVFVHDGGYSTFRGQRWGAPVPDTVDRQRFVVFASNHDQVGNRALGDRPAATLSPGAQAASLAFVLLSPFTPLLFMGEEYGETRPFQFFTDHDEPLGSAVTRGRLAEFSTHGWEQLYGGPVEVPDPQSRATFEASRVDPGVAGRPHDELRAWFAELIAARPRVLAAGAWSRYPVGVSELAARVVRLAGPVEVTANLSGEPVAFQGELLAGFGDVASRGGLVHLAPDTVALSLPKET